MKIKLMNIIIDPEIKVRDVDDFTVSTYAEAMRAGSIFPPIIIDQKNRLVCGHNRYSAYRRVFGPDYEVSCEVSKFKNDVDLIIQAAGDNSRHGKPLSTWDKKCVSLRLKKHGVTPEKISSVLGVRVGKIEEWAGMTVVVVSPDDRKEEKPLKRGYEYMAGAKVKERDYVEHTTHDFGVNVIFHAEKILSVLRRDGWVSSDDRTYSVLKELHHELSDYLKDNKIKGA